MLVAAVTPSIALAHDPSLHRAKAAYGTVVSADKGSLTIEQDGKATRYVIMPDTKILQDGKQAGGVDVKPGSRVAIFAVKLPDGSTAASEMNLLGKGPEGAATGQGQGRPHGGEDGAAR